MAIEEYNHIIFRKYDKNCSYHVLHCNYSQPKTGQHKISFSNAPCLNLTFEEYCLQMLLLSN